MVECKDEKHPLDCPPSDSECVSGDVFMFVKSNPPSVKDLYSNCDKNRRPELEPCIRRALSCGKSIKYLESMQDLFPITRGWQRAVGRLNSKDGSLKKTGSNMTHYSLWISQTIKHSIHTKFKVIV